MVLCAVAVGDGGGEGTRGRRDRAGVVCDMQLSESCVTEIEQYRKYMQLAKTEINAITDPDDQERFNEVRGGLWSGL